MPRTIRSALHLAGAAGLIGPTLACQGTTAVLGPAEDDPVRLDPGNVILIIADDMGKDATSGYPEGSAKPATPNLDALVSDGLTFTNLWVTPTCAPTRACILTGRYGFRTGVTRSGEALSGAETTLQAYIAQETGGAYATAVVGKWHLARSPSFNPEVLGIDHYAGSLGAGVEDYYAWFLTEDGASITETDYNTEVLTDLAIDWIDEQERPWFLWLAYNAPHTPFHEPPEQMHSRGDLPPHRPALDPMPYYLAAIEAMDHEIGRLLDSLTPQERAETTVIFLGDNGTPRRVIQAPYDAGASKGSLYQGGINTPLIVSGAAVTRTGTDASLVNATDLFATIAALAGVDVVEVGDSQSFAALLGQAGEHRDFLYSEIEDGGLSWAVRSHRYKLVVGAAGTQEMFDLEADPYERTDLLQAGLDATQAAAKAALESWADSIHAN